MRMPKRSGMCAALAVAAVAVSGVVGVAPALAESAWWKLSMSRFPTVLKPGGVADIEVQATNLGDAPVAAKQVPVTIGVKLPPWLEPTAIVGFSGPTADRFSGYTGQNLSCAALPARVLSCTYYGEPAQSGFGDGDIPPFGTLEVVVAVKIAVDAPVSDPGEGSSEATIAGGETPSIATRQTLTAGLSTPFGIERNELALESEGGTPDTQAGSHPFQLTSTVALNQELESESSTLTPLGVAEGDNPHGPELPKDLNVKLPPGLVGNANLIPRCSEAQFAVLINGDYNLCPPDSQVGVALVSFSTLLVEYITEPLPIFNLVPSRGEPARFGWIIEGVPVLLDTAVRTGSDYGVTVSSKNISEAVTFVKAQVTLWGSPGAPQHNASRGWGCVGGGFWNYEAGVTACGESEASPKAFLTDPMSCAGPLVVGAEADSWLHPGVFTTPIESTLTDSFGGALGLDGCNRLGFEPSVSVAPDGQAASTPTGLTVGVHVPQEQSQSSGGIAEADVKRMTVVLPSGMQLSPSAADGLQACSDAQIGFTGFAELDASGEPGYRTAQFTPEEQSCPDASKVATVKATSPLLTDDLEGSVYLASPQNFAGPLENPFGSLVALYLVADDPVDGVRVKLPGQVVPDPVTGQLTATFAIPQGLPFEEAELHFFGTDRAPLATPAHCGDYTTTTSIVPWTEGVAEPSSTFAITSGPNGTSCPGAVLPFSPSLTAGMTNINAGGFSPLTTTITREDGDQNVQAVQLRFPEGLSGTLSSVKLCGEAEGDAGTCGPESLIGSTIVSVGLGGDPFSVTGGKVYLTGPYEGAPFGLSIVNPAKAGPFTLDEGRPVVVRAKVEINPLTAALTVTTDNSGPYKIPSILDGIPLQIKHVNVTVERPGFMFNPTNCSPAQVTGSVASTEGASSPVAVPFQVTNCAILKFAPKFAVSTSGKTSKAHGASLSVKLSYPNTPQGTQANITRVKVDLPKQLPSRLTTLQKACTAAQFEANPAGCPEASIIGHATVHTPLLPVPLTGPAYFVSHGGEAFPSLIMVLQGYGVTVDLVGTTFISKAGITSSTFKTVPDVPFNTFELTLPEGKYSALAANGVLCTSKLAMPTEFLAQNGAKINQSTPISVTGCTKKKALTTAQKLATALKTCHKNKTKRTTCEKQARKKYAPAKTNKKTKK